MEGAEEGTPHLGSHGIYSVLLRGMEFFERGSCAAMGREGGGWVIEGWNVCLKKASHRLVEGQAVLLRGVF